MKIIYPVSTNHLTSGDFGFTLAGDKESYSNRQSIYALVFNNEGKIASIKYRKEIGPMYPLPGGGVNESEGWEEGLIREIKEEIGCDITNIKPIGSCDSYDNRTMQRFQSMVCTADLDGQPQVSKPTEDYEQGLELVWVTMEELLGKLEDLADPVNMMKDDRSRFTLQILKKASLI